MIVFRAACVPTFVVCVFKEGTFTLSGPSAEEISLRLPVLGAVRGGFDPVVGPAPVSSFKCLGVPGGFLVGGVLKPLRAYACNKTAL